MRSTRIHSDELNNSTDRLTESETGAVKVDENTSLLNLDTATNLHTGESHLSTVANIRPHLVANGEDLVAYASDLLAMCQRVCISSLLL